MKVLVAVDEAPVSLTAARTAARLFGRAPDVEFLVMNVARVPTPWGAGAPFGLGGPFPVSPEWFDRFEPNQPAIEHRLLDTATAAGIDEPEAVVRIGDPVAEICAAAEANEVDVVVVGCHDKSALRRLIDPSTATAVARRAPAPVLVVHEASHDKSHRC